MDTVILGALFPKEVHDHVPACPVVAIPEGPEEHVERDVPFPAELTEVTAMVTRALSRKEMLESAPAMEAVAKEGDRRCVLKKFGVTVPPLKWMCCVGRQERREKRYT